MTILHLVSKMAGSSCIHYLCLLACHFQNRAKRFFLLLFSIFSLRMLLFPPLFQEMINEIDQDGNGCISFNEFVYLMTKNVHEDGDIEEEIREAFRVFDREGHGFITVPDLCQVLTTLGDKLTEERRACLSRLNTERPWERCLN